MLPTVLGRAIVVSIHADHDQGRTYNCLGDFCRLHCCDLGFRMEWDIALRDSVNRHRFDRGRRSCPQRPSLPAHPDRSPLYGRPSRQFRYLFAGMVGQAQQGDFRCALFGRDTCHPCEMGLHGALGDRTVTDGSSFWTDRDDETRRERISPTE